MGKFRLCSALPVHHFLPFLCFIDNIIGIPSRTGYYRPQLTQMIIPFFSSTSPRQAGQANIVSSTLSIIPFPVIFFISFFGGNDLPLLGKAGEARP